MTELWCRRLVGERGKIRAAPCAVRGPAYPASPPESFVQLDRTGQGRAGQDSRKFFFFFRSTQLRKAALHGFVIVIIA